LRSYLLRKFHAFSSLCLVGLGADMTRCHCNTIGEGNHRFLPLIRWWFKVENIEPCAGQLALPKQF
jgi:hypothetical protein